MNSRPPKKAFAPRSAAGSFFWGRSSIQHRQMDELTSTGNGAEDAHKGSVGMKVVERVWTWLHETFPERQIYIRSDGRVQFVQQSASLLGVLARTKTAMGSRLLARRLCAPSVDIAEIRDRHDQVEAFVGEGVQSPSAAISRPSGAAAFPRLEMEGSIPQTLVSSGRRRSVSSDELV